MYRKLAGFLVFSIFLSSCLGQTPSAVEEDEVGLEGEQQLEIVTVSGEAEILSDGVWNLLELEEKSPIKSQIRTGEDSRVNILLPDDSIIRLDQQTELSVSKYRMNEEDRLTVHIYLNKGHIWLNISSKKPHEYKVETPNLIATARGSIFEVQDDGLIARVTSHKDKIDVSIKSENIIVSETVISSDQQLEITTQDIQEIIKSRDISEVPLLIKKAIHIQELTEDQRSTDFYLYNTELDKKQDIRMRLGKAKRDIKNIYNLKPDKHKIITPNKSITLKGVFQIHPPEDMEIMVDDKKGTIDGLNWEISKLKLLEGRNTFEIVVGDHIADRVVVIKDTISPNPVVVTYPDNQSLINKRYITIKGTSSDDTSEIMVGDYVASLKGNTWTADIELKKGENRFVIKPLDRAKNIGPETNLIVYREYRPKPKEVTPETSVPKETTTISVEETKSVTTISPPKPKLPKEQYVRYPAPTITHPNGGDIFTTCDPYVILRGGVPAYSKAIYINGIAAAVSGDTWSKRMNLYEGQNKFEVLAIHVSDRKSASSVMTISRHDCSKSY